MNTNIFINLMVILVSQRFKSLARGIHSRNCHIAESIR